MSFEQSCNTLLRNDDGGDTIDVQNPCYFGIYTTTTPTNVTDNNDDQTLSSGTVGAPKPVVKFHLISIQPIPAKVGYVEFVDTPSFLTFRSILLQQQPTSCILYTTHDIGQQYTTSGAYTEAQLDAKLLNSVENELILANCPVERQPLYHTNTDQSKIKTILSYHFTPKSMQSDTGLNNSAPTTTTTAAAIAMTDEHTTTLTTKARSIYPEDQITNAYNLCQATILTSSLLTGIYFTTLQQFILKPLNKLNREEEQLGQGNGQANRTKLVKLTKTALQLPMKYLFYLIQPSTKLRIDQNTLNSIGVFPGANESTKSSTSLFGLLNACQTSFGSRLLQSWLKQPLLDIYELNQRQLTVAALAQSSDLLLQLRTALRGIPDIEKILAKLNKYYHQTNSCSNVDRVSSVMSGDIIKELLNLFSFVLKMRCILNHLSKIAIATGSGSGLTPTPTTTLTPTDTTLASGYHNYPDEDELYDIVTQSYEQLNEESGEVEQLTATSQILKTDALLFHSVKMTPQQFLQINYTRELSTILAGLDQFQNLIQCTIDLDAAAQHEFLIKSDITEELTDISKRKGKIHRALDRLYNEAVNHLDAGNNRIKMMHTSANDIGYHLRVTRKDEKLIRADPKTYLLLETRKDGVRFTTVNFQKLSRQYQEEVSRYQLAQATTSLQILDAAMTYCSDFYSLMNIVAQLDVLSSFAHLVVTSSRKYVRPQLISTTGVSIGPNIINVANLVARDDEYQAELSRQQALSFDFRRSAQQQQQQQQQQHHQQEPQGGDHTAKQLPIAGHIMLNAARHPTVEAQPGVVFIPNDVHLKHGETELQLITGPNMGGKSCYLRMTALIVLMAQVGCYVPCDSASICLVDCILARVGAGDMQLKGVSTFMKEMLETGEILHHGSANSLIVVDELGRGTSTYDGFGLAWGIAEYLATRVHSYTLFATHFHEMTAMSEQFKTVSNKHVTALTGEDSITMLYKVQDGLCDRSFGIHVAQMANFPTEVILAARSKADSLEAYAQQSLLQVNLPLKYGDDANVCDINHGSSMEVMSDATAATTTTTTTTSKMAPTTPTGITPLANSFALAAAPFSEHKSFSILHQAFQNHSFIEMLKVQNFSDNEEVKNVIADVYNSTVQLLNQKP